MDTDDGCRMSRTKNDNEKEAIVMDEHVDGVAQVITHDGCLISRAKNDDEEQIITTEYEQSVARMPTEKRSTHYNMNHPKRGKAIIFNHEHFTMGEEQRKGTDFDCNYLVKCLTDLSFDIEVYKDLDFKDLEKVITNVANMDHTDYDCFFLCVMTHGFEGLLCARDCMYKPEQMWKPFTADKCPTLAGKPKMFFIQACRGRDCDKGIMLSHIQSDSVPYSYKIPIHADFLIVYSTVSGFRSWRNENHGSWFIQSLCHELRANQYHMDLLTLLTFVSQRVVIEFETYAMELPYLNGKKQIPCVMSMLTRLVQFTPKET